MLNLTVNIAFLVTLVIKLANCQFNNFATLNHQQQSGFPTQNLRFGSQNYFPQQGGFVFPDAFQAGGFYNQNQNQKPTTQNSWNNNNYQQQPQTQQTSKPIKKPVNSFSTTQRTSTQQTYTKPSQPFRVDDRISQISKTCCHYELHGLFY